jgi:hypothetical protein
MVLLPPAIVRDRRILYANLGDAWSGQALCREHEDIPVSDYDLYLVDGRDDRSWPCATDSSALGLGNSVRNYSEPYFGYAAEISGNAFLAKSYIAYESSRWFLSADV